MKKQQKGNATQILQCCAQRCGIHLSLLTQVLIHNNDKVTDSQKANTQELCSVFQCKICEL